MSGRLRRWKATLRFHVGLCPRLIDKRRTEEEFGNGEDGGVLSRIGEFEEVVGIALGLSSQIDGGDVYRVIHEFGFVINERGRVTQPGMGLLELGFLS